MGGVLSPFEPVKCQAMRLSVVELHGFFGIWLLLGRLIAMGTLDLKYVVSCTAGNSGLFCQLRSRIFIIILFCGASFKYGNVHKVF